MNRARKIVQFFLDSIPELAMLKVFFISLVPFWGDVHSYKTYLFLGAFFSFWSILFNDQFNDGKMPKLYKIQIGIVALIGIVSHLFVVCKSGSQLTSKLALFGMTYVGAFYGLLIAGVFLLVILKYDKNR